ncbi:predicted protein [Sclerotinia sclerotiorum 1980 UF-70]|uniref:Uncharacterized protein n=1 Tax=Sclerotinia sclerotiorum (strain ATCC 18683 / 1980 / Ss-1) TaxID=665079 RepID=A7ECL0_SCLS1|nr:predicted protein [Sclerotinia sclerotiorum 1980 UF-70]EDO00189.1 predicted protein [Sclerotinia sclerotiorum 1980 UF-70]
MSARDGGSHRDGRSIGSRSASLVFGALLERAWCILEIQTAKLVIAFKVLIPEITISLPLQTILRHTKTN